MEFNSPYQELKKIYKINLSNLLLSKMLAIAQDRVTLKNLITVKNPSSSFLFKKIFNKYFKNLLNQKKNKQNSIKSNNNPKLKKDLLNKLINPTIISNFLNSKFRKSALKYNLQNNNQFYHQEYRNLALSAENNNKNKLQVTKYKI